MADTVLLGADHGRQLPDDDAAAPRRHHDGAAADQPEERLTIDDAG
ncbi:hypothetical protein [Novosphingobium gossypii]